MLRHISLDIYFDIFSSDIYHLDIYGLDIYFGINCSDINGLDICMFKKLV